MKTLKWATTLLMIVWASFGVWLSLLAALAFLRGLLPALPDVVSSTLVLLFIHIGIPFIVLFFLWQEKNPKGTPLLELPPKR